ncbi:MAG: arginine--tRNA ligase [Clostridiales bacterium]|nr:arginine--tRNA ligase [Clostridiales bacterium]
MTLRERLTEITADAFVQSGYDQSFGVVTISDRPDLCQFQCNGALAAAKQYRKAPMLIAGEVVEKLKGNAVFSSLEIAAPGFINMRVADAVLSETMREMHQDDRLSLQQMEPRTIVIDFGGPNVAKPLHVGHLRSAIIGDCLCRLARFLGHRVIGDIHLGDWGLQMGLIIAEMKRDQPELPYFDPEYSGEYPQAPPVTAEELNTLYPSASARAKTDDTFAAEAAQATVELQQKRRGYYTLWKHIWNVSVDDLKKNYALLDVHFDQWLGESDADAYIPRVLDILKSRGLLRESEGAQIVDVEQPEDTAPMPPMLIVKSNGGDIYGTTDLGTLLQRTQDWRPDEVWYVVDHRQALHFKQVFRCAHLAGIIDEKACLHIPFGTMNGKDGKPYKTRDGGVMRLSDMIGTVTGNAYQKLSGIQTQDSEEENQVLARVIGVAAMKIGDLINHRAKDYVFDMERFLASEGKTGPYLQYTAVRIRSLLQKAGEAGIAQGPILAPLSDTERELMLSLTSVSEALQRAFEEKAPNIICETLFSIAGVFNRFYFETRFLDCPDAEQRASWLSLLDLTVNMLRQLLDILGVSIPERM